MNIKRNKNPGSGNTALPKLREPVMRGPKAENPLAQRVRASEEPDTIDLEKSGGFQTANTKEPPTRIVEPLAGRAFDWD